MDELTDTLRKLALDKYLAFEIAITCQTLGDFQYQAEGKLWLYQSEKLLLIYDDHHYVMRAKWGKVMVFDGGLGVVRVFRRGPWEAALETVYSKAFETKRQQEMNPAAVVQAERVHIRLAKQLFEDALKPLNKGETK